MAKLLDIPWGASRYFMQKYKGMLTARGGSLFIYKDDALPFDLRDFVTDDFTYARWLEDDYRVKNGEQPVSLVRSQTIFKPREHQVEGAKHIFKAWGTGHPGFLLADKTGVGKTLTTLTGITAIAKKAGFTPQKKAKLLVICPKGVIPVWRQTLHAYPASTSIMRVMVTNYQQLNKLLTKPASAEKAKRQKTKNRAIAREGVPTIDWDFIIFDEGHYLKNYPSSATSVSAVNVSKTNKPYSKGKSPFVVYSTATPGSSPLNFAVMANFLGRLITEKPNGKTVTPKTWGEFLLQEGFAVKKGKVSYTWATVPWFGKNSDDPKERAKYERAEKQAKAVQRKDAMRIGKALKKPGAPFLMRSPKDIAGWPEQQLIPLPIEMTVEQKPIYLEAWTRFRNWLKLTPARSDPKGALVETLRYRQKSSLLKVDSMIEQVEDFIEAGNQVYISVQFIETLEAYKSKLESKGIKCSEISGRNSQDRTSERLRFQKGLTQVVLSTVVEGISLHAGETLPDGSKASSAPRISVIHDVRQNPNDTIQACGRCHRDGENSLLYLPYLESTVEERVILSFVNKSANLQLMTGAKTESVQEMEDIFRDVASNE